MTNYLPTNLLTEENILEIISLFLYGKSDVQIASRFGISPNSVQGILKFKTRKDLNRPPIYASMRRKPSNHLMRLVAIAHILHIYQLLLDYVYEVSQQAEISDVYVREFYKDPAVRRIEFKIKNNNWDEDGFLNSDLIDQLEQEFYSWSPERVPIISREQLQSLESQIPIDAPKTNKFRHISTLSPEEIRRIVKKYEYGLDVKLIANDYGIAVGSVKSIAKNQTRKDIERRRADFDNRNAPTPHVKRLVTLLIILHKEGMLKSVWSALIEVYGFERIYASKLCKTLDCQTLANEIIVDKSDRLGRVFLEVLDEIVEEADIWKPEV